MKTPFGRLSVSDYLILSTISFVSRAIRMTIAYFNPGSGINFDGVGVKPDYEVALTTEQQLSFASLDENTDPQLMKALEVLKAK